jgi:hypothetical protein
LLYIYINGKKRLKELKKMRREQEAGTGGGNRRREQEAGTGGGVGKYFILFNA